VILELSPGSSFKHQKAQKQQYSYHKFQNEASNDGTFSGVNSPTHQQQQPVIMNNQRSDTMLVDLSEDTRPPPSLSSIPSNTLPSILDQPLDVAQGKIIN
jgi:hypothetical protein